MSPLYEISYKKNNKAGMKFIFIVGLILDLFMLIAAIKTVKELDLNTLFPILAYMLSGCGLWIINFFQLFYRRYTFFDNFIFVELFFRERCLIGFKIFHDDIARTYIDITRQRGIESTYQVLLLKRFPFRIKILIKRLRGHESFIDYTSLEKLIKKLQKPEGKTRIKKLSEKIFTLTAITIFLCCASYIVFMLFYRLIELLNKLF